MPRLLTITLTVIAFWSNCCEPLSAQEKKVMPALLLTLKPVKETILAGTAPAFRLTIENVSKAAEKILKPRGDLQDTYYDLEVTKDGKSLNLPRAISDPGTLSSEDFLTL